VHRPACLLVVGLILPVIAIGCGGSNGPGDRPGGSDILGKVVGVSDPPSYSLVLDGTALRTRPAASGDFAIRAVAPGTHTVGVVGPDGMHGAYVAAQCRKGRPVNVGDVRPELGGQIAGIVTEAHADGTLTPVDGVEVVATASNTWPPGTGTPERPIPIGGGDTGPTFSALTDESGSYLMKAVPTGSYDVSVVVPGFDPQMQYVWVDAGHTSVADFTVYPAPEQGVGTVEGVVTSTGDGQQGQPIEGALVTLTVGQPWPVPLPPSVGVALIKAHRDRGLCVPPTDPNDPTRPPWIGPGQFTTLTDANGHYSLNVPVGTHFIECWAEGFEWQGEDVTIERNQTTTRNFDLQRWTEPPPPEPGDPGQPPRPGR